MRLWDSWEHIIVCPVNWLYFVPSFPELGSTGRKRSLSPRGDFLPLNHTEQRREPSDSAEPDVTSAQVQPKRSGGDWCTSVSQQTHAGNLRKTQAQGAHVQVQLDSFHRQQLPHTLLLVLNTPFFLGSHSALLMLFTAHVILNTLKKYVCDGNLKMLIYVMLYLCLFAAYLSAISTSVWSDIFCLLPE